MSQLCHCCSVQRDKTAIQPMDVLVMYQLFYLEKQLGLVRSNSYQLQEVAIPQQEFYTQEEDEEEEAQLKGDRRIW